MTVLLLLLSPVYCQVSSLVAKLCILHGRAEPEHVIIIRLPRLPARHLTSQSIAEPERRSGLSLYPSRIILDLLASLRYVGTRVGSTRPTESLVAVARPSGNSLDDSSGRLASAA
jgi:hypothetical protein